MSNKSKRALKLMTRGSQSAERLEVLIRRTNIRSSNIKKGVYKYLVDGLSLGNAAGCSGIADGNLRKAINSIEDAAVDIEKIKDIDWAHFKNN